MRINTEVRASIAGLLALQIVTAFAAIALLARLGPAIEQILQENVFSIRAVETMERVLAARGTAPPEELTIAFSAALARARSNVTEPGEVEHVEAIEAHWEAALAGDVAEVAVTLEHVEALGEINHESMVRADERAKRLAQAGSWAAVVLALLGFGLSLGVVRRLTRRVVYPLNELHDAVTRYRSGDPHRRCAVADAPTEIVAVTQTINALLDERLVSTGRAGPSPAARDRAVLLHLLDQQPGPTVVMDDEGNVLAASASALERLGDGDDDGEGVGLRRRLHRAVSGGPDATDPALVEKRERIGSDLWLLALH